MAYQELDRSRSGLGVIDGVAIRDPVSWPRFVSQLAVGLLWKFTHFAALLAILSVLVCAIDTSTRACLGISLWPILAVSGMVALGLSILGGGTRRGPVVRAGTALAVAGVSLAGDVLQWNAIWAAPVVLMGLLVLRAAR